MTTFADVGNAVGQALLLVDLPPSIWPPAVLEPRRRSMIVYLWVSGKAKDSSGAREAWLEAQGCKADLVTETAAGETWEIKPSRPLPVGDIISNAGSSGAIAAVFNGPVPAAEYRRRMILFGVLAGVVILIAAVLAIALAGRGKK